LIEKRKINRVIIVADLSPENRSAVRKIAGRLGIELSDWCPEEREILPSSEPVNPPTPSTKYA
jgi:hypothetical protein